MAGGELALESGSNKRSLNKTVNHITAHMFTREEDYL